MEQALARDIDLTAAPNPDGPPVAMLLGDLGRWLTDLDERLTRLEANTTAIAFPLGSRLAGTHDEPSATNRTGPTG